MEIRANLDRLHGECLALKSELKFRAFMPALKANFDPNQPRDEEGQWTDGSSAFQAEVQSFAAHQVTAIFADAFSVPLADRISQSVGDSVGESSEPVLQSVGATISYNTR